VVLLNTPQMTFLHMVPWLLLAASSIFALSGPVSRWLARRQGAPSGERRPRVWWGFSVHHLRLLLHRLLRRRRGFLLITVLSLFGFEICMRSTPLR